LFTRSSSRHSGSSPSSTKITFPRVTDPNRLAAVARELDDVEIVVNNAGVLHVSFPVSASLDVARLELETNYLSHVSMTQAFAPVLERNGGGAFINILSVFS
jgi:NAD(P)-dependent dehydrogenase (short-subunit alcohol dehydrogenase family)